jgi:hypothetical protein
MQNICKGTQYECNEHKNAHDYNFMLISIGKKIVLNQKPVPENKERGKNRYST